MKERIAQLERQRADLLAEYNRIAQEQQNRMNVLVRIEGAIEFARQVEAEESADAPALKPVP